jgi:hypothetical protein
VLIPHSLHLLLLVLICSFAFLFEEQWLCFKYFSCYHVCPVVSHKDFHSIDYSTQVHFVDGCHTRIVSDLSMLFSSPSSPKGCAYANFSFFYFD